MVMAVLSALSFAISGPFATALMAAGWDHGPKRPAPGFPEGWDVRLEGFDPVP